MPAFPKGGVVARMKSVSDMRNHPSYQGGSGNFDGATSSLPASGGDFHAPPPEWQDLVYELAPLAYLSFDEEGRILDFNVAASRLLGVSRKRDILRPLADFFSPRHRRRLARHIAESFSTGRPVVTRLQLRAESAALAGIEMEMSTRPASEALCYRTQLLPMCGGEPLAEPVGDAKFRALVENSSEVVCIGAPDGTVFYTTPSVRRVLGYEPASWFGRNAFEVMPPEHAQMARGALLRLAGEPTGAVLRLVTQIRHADGSWRWVEAILTNLIGQPSIGGIVCNYRDVTEARAAEEALRSSEQRYRLLAESLPQMISIRSSDGQIEYCNSHWREYRGVARQQGTIIHDWQDGIPKEDLNALLPPAWKDGIPRPWKAECRIARASDGALRWHSVRIVPLSDPAGDDPRWLAIASDIHERKQVEQERERLLGQLERERSELALQYAVVRVLAESSTLGEAAPRLLAAFCDQLGWQAGVLWAAGAADSPRPELTRIHVHQQPGAMPRGLMKRSRPRSLKKGQSLAGRVWAGGVPLSQSGISGHRGAAHHRAAAGLELHSAFAFPILLGGEVRGVVELFTRDAFQPGERLLGIVAAAGIQIGQFIERTHALERLRQSEEALIQINNALENRVKDRTAELREANRELSAEIVERTRLEREIIRISEREQRRIGQDLHDGLCQELTAIALMTRALATRLGRDGTPETPRINHVAQLVNASVSRCRDIARGLHPVEMDSDGLMVALNDLAQRTDQTVACSFRCKEPILMPESDVALNLYRIAQEAVNNAAKYSRAESVTITLDRDGSALRLAISDDGRGIPEGHTKRKRNGMGLHIMRYRARTMGATLRISHVQPHGTEVLCILPA